MPPSSFGSLVEELGKQRLQSGVLNALLGEIPVKRLGRLEFLTRFGLPSHRICRFEDHLDNVGDCVPNLIGQSDPGLLDKFDLDIRVGDIVGKGQDFIEGPRAFAEKREPDFSKFR